MSRDLVYITPLRHMNKMCLELKDKGHTVSIIITVENMYFAFEST